VLNALCGTEGVLYDTNRPNRDTLPVSTLRCANNAMQSLDDACVCSFVCIRASGSSWHMLRGMLRVVIASMLRCTPNANNSRTALSYASMRSLVWS
jgi:hypothetical protein